MYYLYQLLYTSNSVKPNLNSFNSHIALCELGRMMPCFIIQLHMTALKLYTTIICMMNVKIITLHRE